mmetsp:Transcript_101406/g.163546  ORF Transcript_101406/g.163546 Transcript_101406/m.163546 type:complete len:86 (+) Transcript_101406:280-537(+)
MRSRDIRFVRVSIMAQGGDSNKRWTLKWTRLLCRSLSASLNLKSGFLQIGLLFIGNGCSGFSFLRKLSLYANNGQSVTAGFTSSN